MKRYQKLFCIAAISTALLSCSSKYETQSTTENVIFSQSREAKNFPAYIEELKAYARLNGISDSTINTAFKDVYHLERVVTADKNQPEKKITLDEYLARALSESRLDMARDKYLQYHSDISFATLASGVPQNYILALWGVESGYGRYQGKEDVISAVSTLAFDGRREKFFTKELLASLTVLDKGYITKDKFKGSWAGAMGQCQFMPSSLLAYGKDGDGDGVIDIWNNTNDVFASIGNYLASVGWKPGLRWGNKVTLPKTFAVSQAGLENDKSKTIAEWKKLGIIFTDKKPQPDVTQKAWVILPDENPEQAYLVYDNFKALMNWNRSYYFGISVGLLADSLVETSLHE